jgi:L-serine dehydratase
MAVSAFDLFTVGIGPSSSHTVGPMKAALLFVRSLQDSGDLDRVHALRAELFGSLGATGHGHGSVPAVILGLQGETPEAVDPAAAAPAVRQVTAERRIRLLGWRAIDFDPQQDVVLHRRRRLDFHTNGLRFAALDAAGATIGERDYYSIGGGFVLDGEDIDGPRIVADRTPVRYPFRTGSELIALCAEHQKPISAIMMGNELSWRTEPEVRAGLLHIWDVMQECVRLGTQNDGVLPGGLEVRRRAARLHRTLSAEPTADDPMRAMDWVMLYALAVNEENAAGGRVVTAPTNGAAGIVPAVLHYYRDFVPTFSADGVVRFLLTAAAIGVLFKENASISGAEVGCQGEVGSACSMAAAGLAEVLGGTARQVENAAEIGIEHNLGLTCDPIGGLVQIPCIERNAVASVKAITAARLAVRGDGRHHVSLDKAIKTMRETGADMKSKYKETARGGLALNVVEC